MVGAVWEAAPGDNGMLAVEIKPQAWSLRLADADPTPTNPLMSHVRDQIARRGSPAYRRRLASAAGSYARHMGGFAAFESTTALIAFAVLADYSEAHGVSLAETLELLGDAPAEAHDAARWVLAQGAHDARSILGGAAG